MEEKENLIVSSQNNKVRWRLPSHQKIGIGAPQRREGRRKPKCEGGRGVEGEKKLFREGESQDQCPREQDLPGIERILVLILDSAPKTHKDGLQTQALILVGKSPPYRCQVPHKFL